MRLLILIFVLLLSGCVTVYSVPPTSESGAFVRTERCTPYEPPRPREAPALDLPDSDTQNYTRFLEELTEGFATHIRKLTQHIEQREIEHGQAYRRYLHGCEGL